MIKFAAVIQKFDSKGEKTGWTYIDFTAEIAQQLKPDTKVSFLVKGRLDNVVIQGVSLLPMGGGNFLLPLKSDLRRKIKKNKGSVLQVQLEEDHEAYQINKDFLECLKDSPDAASNFSKLSASHQNYFSKWIDSAKTELTKAKRIAQAVEAMHHNLSYSEMIRKNKAEKSF